MINMDRVVERYLNILKRQNKDKTFKTYRKPLYDLVDFMEKEGYESAKLDERDFTEGVLNFQDELAVKYNNPATYNLKINAVRSFINYASDRMLINENFSKKLKYKKDNSKSNLTSKNVLSGEELSSLLDFLRKEIDKSSSPQAYYTTVRNYVMVNLLFRLGLRREELCNIRWDDINFRKKTIRIHGKGNKDREIPLVEQMSNMLFDYYERLEDIQDAGFYYTEPYVFTSARSGKLNLEANCNEKLAPHSINLILKDTTVKFSSYLEQETGETFNKSIYPHLLRHTFASHAIESNVSPSTLQAIMGHSDVSITLKIYTHEINDKVRRTNMEKIDFGTGDEFSIKKR